MREQIIVGRERRQLTPLQWSMVEVLRARQGRTVTREFIMDCLYGGAGGMPDIKVIDVMLCRIRPLLAGTPYHIVSQKGVGLRFERKDEAPINR